MVTFGDKDTYTLKLRGVGANRIALLVDGVPVYEPYFGTFDLKTVSAGGIDTIQVTKGPSSVLYGPNTLGGLVNVITKRPAARAQPVSHRQLRRQGHEGPGRRRLLRLEAVRARGRRPLPGLGRLLLSRPGERPDSRATNSDYRAPQPQRQALLHALELDRDHGQRRPLPVRVRHARRPCSRRGPATGASPSGTGRPSTRAGSPRSAATPSCASGPSTSITTNTLDLFNDAAMTDLDTSSTYDNSVLRRIRPGRAAHRRQEHGQDQPALPEGHRPHPGRHRPALGPGSIRARSRPGSRTTSA